jgi:2-alkyl-3-oxoalkanoate reductase
VVITITGAAGMLGSRLAERLVADGHDVRGVDLRRGPSVEILGDIRDRDVMDRALSGADMLVHTAAGLPSYPDDLIRSIIIGGTENVFAAASAARVPRVIHISSTAVYGLPTIVPTPEDYPREPVDTYSHAKAAAEEIAEKYRAAGMCVPILRPKTFIGPGRRGLFSMLFEWADEGRNFPVLGKGDVRIQMFGIDDLIEVLVTVIHAPDEVANDTYNLAAEEFGTLREDFQAVLDAAGHGKRVIGLPTWPALAVLSVLQRARLSPVYGRLLHKLRNDSYVEVGKAKARLGFRPKLSNREAILQTFEWWRSTRDDPGDTAPVDGGSPDQAATVLPGRTSRDPWRQGVLSTAKIFF